MATVRKIRSKWQCLVRRKGYPHQARVFNTEQEAADWGDQVEDAMRDGTFDDKPKEPPPKYVRDLLGRYLKEVSPGKAQDGRSDTARIERLQRVLGDYSVHTLTSSRVTRYKNDRLAEEAAAQTVLHELVLLHHAYAVACEEWGLELHKGIPRTRRPKLPKGRNQRIPASVVRRIRLATSSPDLGDVVEFAIESCMRRSEIAGIGPGDVSLSKGTVFLEDTKNGESRTVPLTPRAREIIQKRMQAGYSPVFRMRPDSITQAFGRAVKRAGIDGLRFHDTRHEGISRLLEQGYTLIEAARISGHKTLTQLNRYAHLDVQHIVEKMAELEEAA